MRLSLQQKEQFFHEMREMIQSGRSVAKALETKANGRTGPLRTVAEQMVSGAAGDTAESYFDAAGDIFSTMDREVVRGGEQSGRLDAAMGYLSDYYGALARTRRDILIHVAYPVFLLHFGALMLAIPALVTTGFTEFLVQVACFLGAFYVVGALIWFGLGAAIRAAKANPSADQMLQSIPGIGGTRVALVGARFCMLMSILVKASGSIFSALDRAAAASGSALFQRGAQETVLAVQGGDGLSAALMRTHAFPESIDRAFQVGELSGRLDEEMHRLAERFTEQLHRRLAILSKWAPILIFLVIGLVIAFRIVSYYLGYFHQVNELLQ
jgi:type II secretory pathway component PulF